MGLGSLYRRRRLAAPAALTILLASSTPVGAVRTSGYPWQLEVLTASQGRIWFLQRDGRGTTIEVATGAVTRGGARHDDWPRPRRCEPGSTECRLAAGVLTITYTPERERILELRSEKGHWQVGQRRVVEGPPGGIWEVDGTLLIHSPQWGISTVECLDIASGRARWIYAYPTPWPRMAWAPMGDRDEVSAARAGLQGLERAVRHRSEGPVVVVDPDPMRRSTVRVGFLLGWAAVVAALALGAMRLLGKPAGAHFTALTIGLALVIVAVGLIDSILVGALWLVFLGVFGVATADKAAPRGLLWTVVVVTTVIVWVPSFMASIQR